MTLDRHEVDCAIIGAGVVGLAIARAFACAGRDVIVLERHAHIGMETSSHNSEVIHAGIYYPTGSRKAQACVRGKHLLYEYCDSRKVPHQRIGKLIVAARPEQKSILENYQSQGHANGVDDLTLIDPARVRELEPAVRGDLGLLSPSTGIVDSHALMLSLQGELEDHSGAIAFECPVERGICEKGRIELVIGGRDPMILSARTVINCAGLEAVSLARRLEGSVQEKLPQAYYAVGHYFLLSGRSPFNRLVYPVAEDGGLGVHVTLDMGGQVRFGPDVSWVDKPDYTFDESRKIHFLNRIREYFPALSADRLVPGYTGIRPKITGPDGGFADFEIMADNSMGDAELFHLFGIESPGLTSSLALAEEVLNSSRI